MRVVRQEGYEYNDPVTDFIKALYIDFDFEEAQKKLGEAEEILKGDFFLSAAADAFVEAARHLISESYCKIHERIDIKCVFPFPFPILQLYTRNLLLKIVQGSISTPRPEPRRGREVDRQSNPGHENGR